MYLAALANEFGWSFDDPHLMAKGMIVGHLLECGSQVSGGCFADPGYKDVPDIANLSNPIAEVTEDRIIITKLPDTGGVVSVAGTVLGAAMVTIITNGLLQLQIGEFWVQMCLGLILLAAVLLDRARSVIAERRRSVA